MGWGIIQFGSIALQDSRREGLSDFSWDKSLPAGEQENGRESVMMLKQTAGSKTVFSAPLPGEGKAIQRSAMPQIPRDYLGSRGDRGFFSVWFSNGLATRLH